MPKLTTVAICLSALILTVIIPVFELNATHITNPAWPAHARLHEAWQLLTNAAISLLALGCVLTDRAPRLGITLALVVSASFLVAWALGPIYGGSMLHTDGTQLTIGGINVVVIVVTALTALLGLSLSKTKVANISQEDGV